MPTIQRKWAPHASQKQIIDSTARFRAAACGRRFGKTEAAHNEVCEFGFDAMYNGEKTDIWWVAPTYQDAHELGFEPLERKIPDSLMRKEPKRSEPRYIYLVGNVDISFRTAEKEKSLRGRGIDFVVIDESGEIQDNIYQGAIRPALSDTLGDLLAIGTPKGRNWFHTLFERGQDPSQDNVASWQFSSYDNPFVKNSEIEQARQELPSRVFKQEYLAKFLEDEGAVFGNVRDRNAHDYALADARGQAPYSIGVDLARSQNFTAITVLDAVGTLVHADRIRKNSWSVIGSKIRGVANEYGPCTTYMDASRDNKLIEDLQHHTNVVETRFTAQKKREIIENLAARLEMKEIMLSTDAEQLLAELSAYEYDTTPSGNVSYGAPSGLHDDYVDSLALAAQSGAAQAATW